MQIKASEILEIVARAKGRWFSCTFIKRTNGETRLMSCRRGVKKYLKGGGPAYDFASHALISVWDRHKKDYRVIPIEGVISLKVNGVVYQVAKDFEQGEIDGV